MAPRFIALFASLLTLLTVPVGVEAQRLSVQGGPVVMQLDPVGSPSVEDLSAGLRWNRVRSPSKIVVSSSAPIHRFALSVDAINTRRGISLGEVALIPGDPAQDLVIGIEGPAAGACTLRYVAEARPEQGYGTDIHTVTYTITGQ